MILLWCDNNNFAVAWYGTRNVLSDFKERIQIQIFENKNTVKVSSPKKNTVSIAQPGTLWFVQTTHMQINLN
jgi:hypothetical protein